VPEEAVTYATRVRRTLQTSVANLVSFAQDFSIGLVFLAPWLGVLLAAAVVLMVIVWIVRRRKR